VPVIFGSSQPFISAVAFIPSAPAMQGSSKAAAAAPILNLRARFDSLPKLFMSLTLPEDLVVPLRADYFRDRHRSSWL
jgi:hypothetical protein